MGRLIPRTAPQRRFVLRNVLIPLLVAAGLFGVTLWVYADQTAFARRAVHTTATIVGMRTAPGAISRAGSRPPDELATVRFTEAGRPVETKVWLVAGWGSYRVGQSIRIGYDPAHPSTTESPPQTRYPFPNDVACMLGFWGLIALAAGLLNLMLGDAPKGIRPPPPVPVELDESEPIDGGRAG